MFDKNFLNDNWELSGNNIDDFKTIINKNNELTKFMPINSKDISLISLLDNEIKEKLKLDSSKDYVFKSKSNPHPYEILLVLSAYQNISEQSRKDISICTPTKEMLEADLYKEFKMVKTMLSLNGDNYFLSANFFKNLERFGLAGEFFVVPSLQRDLTLTSAFAKNKDTTICIKEYEGQKKAFALLSGKYANINQSVVFDIIKLFESELGSVKVKLWNISHFMTSLSVEFPDYAEELNDVYKFKTKYIPGIQITTSDTGDCALRIRGTLRKEDSSSVTYFEEVSRKHIGKIDLNKLMNEIKKEIFSKYTLIPEKMIELLEMDISPDDLKTESDRFKNTSIVKEYFDFIIKESQLVKIVGKKTKDLIRDALYERINDTYHYTLYDIVDLFMIVPETIVNLNEYTLNKLRVCVSKTPFIDFSKCKKVEIEL